MNIPQSRPRGKSTRDLNTPANPEVVALAIALLNADRHLLDKSDRDFLQVAKRHGLVGPEGRARLGDLAHIVGGAK